MSASEDELKEEFQKYGSVLEVFILRERGTQKHRGCCFVRYETRADAEKCIEGMNNKMVYPKQHNPLEVRLADGEEVRLDNKVFVGQLPESCSEADVRQVFEPFGALTEVVVLQKGRPSAFVKFINRSEAEKAIEELDGKFTMPGSSQGPLKVSFAQTKGRHGLNQMLSANHGLNPMSLPPGTHIPPVFTAPGMGGSMGGPMMLPSVVLEPKMYVAGLPTTIELDQVKGMFMKYGAVMDAYLLDGNSKGCAFVKMQDRSACDNAIRDLNGKVVAGSVRMLTVRYADKAVGGGGGAKGGAAGGTAVKLFVGGLPPEVQEKDLYDTFAFFGPVQEVYIKRNADGGHAGFAFVRLVQPHMAEAAIATFHNVYTMPGAMRPMTVKLADGEMER
eukprot:CAMPEP_0113939970 /NCGR_PEP_ID=MMETSP1339-20121228/6173_1 /TAXON_ID=94617 /ORGANISM="Fibrocapsa japonica" /LENGTH=388 /DNA_ID=CAMNT_0000943623 /DNA_START=119 /DNA_END=1282 /DNA_ORIENTATION=- /assembly_acc=CAM_ASM_000762